MEKLDLDTIEETVVTPIASEVESEPEDKAYHWVNNVYEFTKTCEKCGAVMRGWAYRQDFPYCPMCGTKLQ